MGVVVLIPIPVRRIPDGGCVVAAVGSRSRMLTDTKQLYNNDMVVKNDCW